MNSKESLIDLLVHDMAGPLTIASTSINKLIKKQDRYGTITERQETALNMALRNINKAKAFIREITEVYRSEEGLFIKDSCSIQDILKNAIIEAIELIKPDIAEKFSHEISEDKFNQLLEENGITIDITGKYSKTYFYHDRNKIQQILRNLITNALKFRQEKVSIAASGDDELIIAIRNDGSGIAQENQGTIFNRFSQLKDKEDNDLKGLGFGLSCVKLILETMSGNIELSSCKGEGVCFTIRIPPMHENIK